MRRSKLTTSTLDYAVAALIGLSVIISSAPVFASTQGANLRQGLPGRRISGGSRSPSTACLITPNQPIIALMPEDNIGLTLSEHPTLWFSLPAVSPDRNIEFGLFDQAGKMVYEETLVASGEAGLTHLQLPATATPLEVNKNYRWYLSVVCDPQSRSEDLFVTGWIKRIQPDSEVSEQLIHATDQERLSLYEASALWYDELTTLITLRRNDPTAPELAQRWNTLLNSVNLTQALNTPGAREL